MAEAATNAVARVDRATLIWRMRVKGKSQHEIAQELKISQPAVSKHLKRRSTQMLALLKDQVEEQKVLATARLEAVIDEAWQGWQNSLGEIGYTTTKRLGSGKSLQADGSIADVQPAVTESTTRSSKGVGNTGFLNTIIKAQEQIAKIWGFEKVDRDMPEVEEGVDWAEFTPEEIDKRIKAVRAWNERRRQKVIEATAEPAQ